MDEVIYYSDPQCVISSTRVEIDGQTVALRNVTAVREDDAGTPIGGIVLGIIGAGAVTSAPIFGACVLVVAAYIIWRRVTSNIIKIDMSSGTALTISGNDAQRSQMIRAALSRAIAAR